MYRVSADDRVGCVLGVDAQMRLLKSFLVTVGVALGFGAFVYLVKLTGGELLVWICFVIAFALAWTFVYSGMYPESTEEDD